jgi:hypothetical protein
VKHDAFPTTVDHLRLDLLALPVTPHQLRVALIVVARRAATDRERLAFMRIHEEVSLWQAADNAAAHLRRSTAARLVEMLHAAGAPSPPLTRDVTEVLVKVCAEVRRVAAIRAAPLRPEEARTLASLGALPPGRLAPVDAAIAATAQPLHLAMRSPR